MTENENIPVYLFLFYLGFLVNCNHRAQVESPRVGCRCKYATLAQKTFELV